MQNIRMDRNLATQSVVASVNSGVPQGTVLAYWSL